MNDFLNYLIIDKNYSKNTKISYEEELKKYQNFLNEINKTSFKIKKDDINNYLSNLSDLNLDSKTISHIILYLI